MFLKFEGDLSIMIISDKTREYYFGIITHYLDGLAGDSVVKIEGVPKSSPNFINPTDKDLWNDNWNAESRDLKINYSSRRNGFVKDDHVCLSEKDVKICNRDMCSLMEPYDIAAEKYNKEIAEPFIEERKTLLNKVFEAK